MESSGYGREIPISGRNAPNVNVNPYGGSYGGFSGFQNMSPSSFGMNSYGTNLGYGIRDNSGFSQWTHPYLPVGCGIGSNWCFTDPRNTFENIRFGQYDVPFASPFTPQNNMWTCPTNPMSYNNSFPMSGFPNTVGNFGTCIPSSGFPFMSPLGMQCTLGGTTPLLGREIDQMLWKKGNIANKLWVPRTNILDEGDYLKVEVELPGVSSDAVRVALTRNVLVISPAKPIPQFPQDKGLPLQHESHYGYFFRQIPLPETVEAKKIVAEFEDGILRITIPKTSEEAGQKININKK